MIGKTASTPSMAGDERFLAAVVSGNTHDPHALLGAHPTGSGSTIIRTMRKGAKTAAVVMDDERTEMTQVHPDGIFAVEVPGTVLDYRIDADGSVDDDPYRHLPTLGELDLHL